MDKHFSPRELTKQKNNVVEVKGKSKSKNGNKYITKIINGVKYKTLNPNYAFKHNN